jgi:hypothetical protein
MCIISVPGRLHREEVHPAASHAQVGYLVREDEPKSLETHIE